ncbi:MAG: hypothetical protein AB7K09_26450 [Planctomycetota bacterium]
MEIAFDRYRLRIGYGARTSIAREARQQASTVVRLDGSGQDETWIVVRDPEVTGKEGPYWAIRLRYDRHPRAPVALAVISHTHRLFVGADRDHWVVDLQGRTSLSHRRGTLFQQFQVFADGVLGVDEEHLSFYGPFGKPRWEMKVARGYDYSVQAGNFTLLEGEKENVFPLVSGPATDE